MARWCGFSFNVRGLPALLLAGACGAVGAVPVTGQCPAPVEVARVPGDEAVTPAPAELLASLVREAVARSADVRGAVHGSRAAQLDLQQTQASGQPNLALAGSLGLSQSRIADTTQSEGRNANLTLALSAPLYDSGRLDALTRYQRHLADGSDLGLVATRERVVRDALATSLERLRYLRQLRVYDLYVGQMQCLVGLLEQVVELDRGRGSELVQARKALRQAELSRGDMTALLRQTEARLVRLVGAVELPEALAVTLLRPVPPLDAVLGEIDDSPEVRQLAQQVAALDQYARVVRAESGPQVRWQVGATQARQPHVTTAGWNAGLTLGLTLADGGAAGFGTDAAVERAEVARRQHEAAVEERIRQAAQWHDAATSAQTRAARVAELLRDSDQLREATYEQWARMGRRSLFDLISAETDYYQLRLAQVNAQHDAYAAVVQLRGLGAGVLPWLRQWVDRRP